ncbi:MAG: endonuclease/exonuclease/phosphatase family protein [Campylobacterota bacterium]|nr:endonuclease/exonuclease/phosphatase family protein [Campylobacterota bacterium]
MLRPILLLLIPLFLLSKEVKIASYNVENLFDDVKNGSEYDEYQPGKHNWTKRMVEIKLNHTAEVLCDLDADIIGLQEIENPAILLRLQKRLKRVGCPYPYASITQKKRTAIHVALLSKYPITKKRELQVNYSDRDRNILEATVDIDEYPLTLFVNHWKAKSRGGKESRRIRSAKVLKKRIDTLPKGSEYVVIGDLNSHYDEHRVIRKNHNDTNGITGINHILKTVENEELVSETKILSDKNGNHYNLWLERPASKRWSHKYYGNKGAVDHIILPQTLFDKRGVDYINNSFGVFKASYLFQKKGWINSWRYKSGKHKGKGYSDHLPVYASFSTEPYKKEKQKNVAVKKIEDLYKIEKLDHLARLEGCIVIFKRGNNAVIKQSPKGMAIYLYGAARGLKEGGQYDLTVSEIKEYRGLKEIIGIDRVKKRGEAKPDDYYLKAGALDSGDPALQNQIFVNLTGIYRKEKLEIDGKQIPIFFKRKKWKPKEGSKIKILYAHLGYYHKPQLVIYGRKDFEGY